MNDAELVQYYKNLLIAQYKAKASATVGLLVNEIISNQLLQKMLDYFDLTNATGKQLDIIGQFVGVRRILYGYDPSIQYFQFATAGVSPTGLHGFGIQGTVPTNYFLSTTRIGSISYTLTDDLFRRLIQLRIDLRRCNHSMHDVSAVLNNNFGTWYWDGSHPGTVGYAGFGSIGQMGNVMILNQTWYDSTGPTLVNANINYIYNATYDTHVDLNFFNLAVFTNSLPHPVGVTITTSALP